jgi:hypothetical protein
VPVPKKIYDILFINFARKTLNIFWDTVIKLNGVALLVCSRLKASIPDGHA